VELFWVPCRILFVKSSTLISKKKRKTGTKRFLPGTKKGSSKSYPMGTAEEPF
jgi:hypothetical protein